MNQQDYPVNKKEPYISRREKRENAIREISEPMQEYALAHPALTHSEIYQLIESGKFSQLIKINNTYFIHCVMTISPADDETEIPFWHCSMSFVSVGSGKAKSVVLWTKREHANIRDLLPRFLGERGLKDSQQFSQTKTALHCHRDLTVEELVTVEGNINGHI